MFKRNNKTPNKQSSKESLILGVWIILSFIAILIYNWLTPLMSDDLLFKRELYGSLKEILYEEYLQYHYWTGRSVLQLLLKFSSLMPKSIFNIINSVFFVVLSLLIYCNIPNRKRNDSFLFLTIQLFLWLFSVEFGQTMLWLGGSCNYLWGIVIILGFVTLFRIALKKNQENTNSLKTTIWGIVLFLSGILAGWGNENTSGGAILFLIMIIVVELWEKRRIPVCNWIGLCGSCIGFCFMVFAPGNQIRASLMVTESNYSGLAEYGSRFFKLCVVLQQYFVIYYFLIAFLIAYGLCRGNKIQNYLEPLMWSVAGLATSGVLVFVPEPMPRAYFGAGIFLTIASTQLLWKLNLQQENGIYCVRQALIVCGCIWMIFTYLQNGLNLARILREVQERDEYVFHLEEKPEILVLPKLRPQFQTKYSYMYENDISEKEDWWSNTIYASYYSTKKVVGIEREEWTEY